MIIYDDNLFNRLSKIIEMGIPLGFSLADDKMKHIQGTEVYPVDVTYIKDRCIDLSFVKIKTKGGNKGNHKMIKNVILQLKVYNNIFEETDIAIRLDNESDPFDYFSIGLSIYKNSGFMQEVSNNHLN